jgi:hypothetical protein
MFAGAIALIVLILVGLNSLLAHHCHDSGYLFSCDL